MKYRKRMADELLERKLESFGATLIVGPKGCGKTTTAKQQAKSVIEFQDEDYREGYLAVAQTAPSRLLVGEKPRLFDEWQDAPKIWGAIRKSIDDTGENGAYILTGSSAQLVKTPHTGTQRISTLKMYPMSLYESGESNGEVSLLQLFDAPDSFQGCFSNMTWDQLIFAICRGGWPRAVNNKTEVSKLEVAKDYFRQVCERDISSIDQVSRNPVCTESIMKSYARNICTIAKTGTIYDDVNATYSLSESTFFDYVDALEKLFILEDVDAWNPSIRSKTAIRSAKKKNFVDPSIAVAAMGISPEYFNTDYKTLGFLFESLCIRDLRIYSAKKYGRVSYYRDRYGLESDIVIHLEDGRYALVEVKLGADGIDDGAMNLCKLEALIKKYNADDKKKGKLAMPTLKIVLTASSHGYRRPDGVLVIPISCLSA